MVDLHWTSYVGMVSGIIGTITGIAGAIMGYVSYRRSNQVKALDLRIELKRSVTNSHYDLKKLGDFMETGNKSRMAVASAMGVFHSSMMEKWKREFESDQTLIARLANELPDEDTTYDHLDPKQLEAELIKLHKIQREIQKVSEKYSEAMEWDNEQRKQYREDMRSRSKP